MSNTTAENFAERMKFLAAQDFGGSYRPGLVAAIANGTASTDDMTMISGFVKALDLAKVAQANQAAGINAETSPQNSDLLASIGEDGAIVQRMNSSVTDAADPNATGQYLNHTLQTIAQYSANSGDVFLPQSTSFAPGKKAPDGSSNESIPQKVWGGAMTALSWLGRIPGFLYQAARQDQLSAGVNMMQATGGTPKAIATARKQLGLDSIATGAKAAGYDPNNPLSEASFLWSHGESDFSDLGPAIARHGQPLVDTAVKMYQADVGYGSSAKTLAGNSNFEQALASYQAQLNVDLQTNKITPQQYAAELKNLSASDLHAAYDSVDAAHASFGRDLARVFFNYDDHVGAFKYISGTADLGYSLFADPTLAVGKAFKGIQAIRYGGEALADESKVARLYGVADKVTGEIPKLNPVLNRGAIVAQKRVTTFLQYNKEILAAHAAGDHALGSALFAENAARHRDLMPMYMEAQGWRAASTPEEIAKAKADGTTLSLGGDALHEIIAPARSGDTPEEIAKSTQAFKDASIPAVLKAKPIENLDEWVDLLVAKGGLTRWTLGLPIRQARMLPGLMGPMGEIRASLMGRLAFNRVLAGAETNPFISAMARGEFNHSLSEINYATDEDKLIASDAGEAAKTAFAARESGQSIAGRAAESWVNFARSLKAKTGAADRMFTSYLPTNHLLALNGTQAGADMERLARSYLPKDQASFARYMWDNADNEAGRRQIARAVINQIADVSGATRSPAGRAWMEAYNAAWDEADKVRYGLADTDKINDVFQGERRTAMNIYQLETHVMLPPIVELRRLAAKAAVTGFDKPLGEINAKAMKSWFTKANGDQDVMAGIRRMLASPIASVRYGLFHNDAMTRMFQLVKLGWLGTTANALRQLGEEYVGLRLGRHGADLAEGKRLDRLMGGTTAIVAKIHHLIPHFLRPSIASEGDAYSAITRGRLAPTWGERPLQDALDHRIVDDLNKISTQREVAEILGSRQATLAEGGAQDAIEAHLHGVPMQKIGWKKAQFAGYTEGELEGDSGRKALAASYAMFLDKDEPARRVLAYLMWNHAAEKPKFLAKLDPETIDLMHKLVPVDDASLAAAKAGKRKGITPPLMDSIKDYVKDAPEMGVFRQRAERLRLDESGHPLAADDQVGKNAAIERYVHSQVYNVAQHVYARTGGSMDADLVSKLLRGKTPSELELGKIPLKDLPEHVIRAEYMPAATTPLDKFGEVVTAAAVKGGKAFDHIVTRPMYRLERKPLFYGNYSRALRDLQPYEKMMLDQGFAKEDAEGITSRMALGRALQDTVKYIDNPKVASQLSAVIQNWWLFYRAQEDFYRRWIGIVKERPESLRLAQMAVQGSVQSGMMYRDSDGNLTMSYPGSGAIIDAFLMAQKGLGIGDDSGIKIPQAHDLTTQLTYLNPSLMNPAGYSATPMVTIPWEFLKVAIPGHDALKSNVDMGFYGQLGNGRSWWEQFMPTAINRIMTLQGDNSNTGSQVGSAAATTILNASLSGQLNDGADDVRRQQKVTDLKTQTLAALYARALFAFAAPGATSMPELDYKDGKGNWIGNPDSDLSWRAMGIANLKDEYRAMIQSFGVDKANVVWAELHPNYLSYEVGKTTLGAPSANADPTALATQWILDNKDLFQGPYKRVAAYFIPPAPGTFDQAGWNTMQEIGVRQSKDLEQYYLDIASKNAVSSWYNAKDKYEGVIKQQRAAGQNTSELESEYANVKAGIKAEYPILDSYFAAHGSRQTARTQMVNEVRSMVKDPSVKLPDLKGAAQMLTVLDNYNAQQAQLKGQRSVWASTQRQDLNSQYESTMAGIIKEFPNLQDLYNGVFREMEQ